MCCYRSETRPSAKNRVPIAMLAAAKRLTRYNKMRDMKLEHKDQRIIVLFCNCSYPWSVKISYCPNLAH
jgi:hypothetical protein